MCEMHFLKITALHRCRKRETQIGDFGDLGVTRETLAAMAKGGHFTPGFLYEEGDRGGFGS
jgi:hypothetical protein